MITMYPPDEIMTDVFLPSLRSLISIELMKRGFSQSKISKLLGITQPMVSTYVNSGASESMKKLYSLGLSDENISHEINFLIQLILTNQYSAVEYLLNMWQKLLAGGKVCPLHVKMYPQLKGCDVCMRMYSSHADKDAILKEIERCAKIIESSQSFVSIIPEVSSNIARCKDDASAPSDVAAIPGRIIRVGNNARASSKPEFGASKHLSLILLEARKKRKDVNSVINIKFDRKIYGIIRKLGLKIVTIEGPYPEAEDRVAEAFKIRLKEWREDFDVLIDKGGKGVEPNLYIFGKDAYEVTSIALKVAELYSSNTLSNL
jgi:predicted fused transcriptional regulator/phosphomethylpyrimidine kinase/predicted transcriptional regulator